MRQLCKLPFLLLVGACSGEADIVTNGFNETIIDRTGRHGQGFRVVDIDGDGNLDVVAALSLTDAVHVYFRKEDVNQEWERISVSGPGRIVAMDVDVGDVDGDGDLDIAAVGLFQRDLGAGSAGDLIWYENPGDPRGVWTSHEVSTPRISDDMTRYISGIYGARAVRLADLDGDGDADIVVGALEAVATRFDLVDGECGQVPALGNGVHWFSNRGDGTFDGPLSVDPDLAGVSQLVTADIDQDGRMDLLASASITQALVWYRNTAGTDGPSFVRYVLQAAGGQYFGMQAANVDDDPALEVVAVTNRATGGYVHVFDPPADLTGVWPTSTVAAGIGAVPCTVNEDCPRQADFCATVQTCTGTVAAPATPCDPVELCANDEDDNGDGLVDCDDPTCGVSPECAECTENRQCSTAPAGQVDPTPCEENEDCPRVLDLCAPEGFCPAAVTNPVLTVADLSGDGRADIVIGEASGLLQRYYQQDGGAWERRDIRTGYTGINYLNAADIDGDGCLDILSSTYELGTRDRLSWWKNVDCVPQ